MELQHYINDYHRSGVKGFAAKLNVTRQTVHNWLSGKAYPSPKYILDIETITNGKVKGSDLSRTYRDKRFGLNMENLGIDINWQSLKTHSVAEPHGE